MANYNRSTLTFGAVKEMCERVDKLVGTEGVIISVDNDCNSGEGVFRFVNKKGKYETFTGRITEYNPNCYKKTRFCRGFSYYNYDEPCYIPASLKYLVEIGLMKKIPILEKYVRFEGATLITDLEAIKAYVEGCYLGDTDITDGVTMRYGYKLIPNWAERLQEYRAYIKKNNYTYRRAMKMVDRMAI